MLPAHGHRSYLGERSHACIVFMEQNEVDTTDRCVNGRCWVGPVLVVETKGGAIPDLTQWIKITLSRHYDKATTLGLMSCLSFSHVYEEHAIMAFAIGREPAASVIREVFARVKLDHEGVLKSNCSTYHFTLIGEGEQERCDALIAHYGWVETLAKRISP